MAIPFLHNIDLSNNQALHMKLHTGSSSPFGTGNNQAYDVAAGQIWFDSANKYIKIHDGTQFVKAPREITITTGSGQNEVNTTLGSFQNLKLIESTNITFTLGGAASDATKTLTISSQDTTYGLDVPTVGLVAPNAGNNEPGEANITLTDSASPNPNTYSVLIKGTDKEVDVTGDATNETIQIGLPDNVTITQDLTINGGELFYHANHTIKSTDPVNTAAGKTLTLSGGDVIAGGTVDLAGGDITIQGGAGKGTGDGGDIIFKIAKAGQSSSSTVNALSTALTISGNDGDATFANNVTITGDLTVNGDTTNVNVTTMTVEDPVIELGGLADGGAPTSNDTKDRGISFNWYQDGSPSGVAKLGFFGYDEDTGYFTFIPEATNTSEVFSGTKGVADLGGVRVPDSGLVLNGTAVDSTAAELNKLDAGEAPLTASEFTDTLQDGDAIIIGDSSDNNTTKKVLLSKVAEYVDRSERKSIKIVGDGSTTTFHVEHGFDTHLVSVQLLDYGDNGTGATYDQVYADITVGTVPQSGGTSTDANDYVNVTFATAPSTTQDYIALVSKFPALS